MRAYAKIYLDYRAKQDGSHNVKIRVTFDTNRKHYGTDVDLKPDEFDKIFYPKKKSESLTKDSFTVMDFLSEYQKLEPYESKPMFHRNNAKVFIDTYIEYKKFPFRYIKAGRRWNSINDDNSGGEDNNSEMPF